MHLAEEKCSEPDTGAPDFRWGQVPRNPSHVENIPSQKRFSSPTPPNPRAWPAAWNVRGAPRPRPDTPVAASPSQQTRGARALASTMGLEPCPEALAGARPRGLTGSAVHPGQRHRTAPRPAPGVLAARGPPCFGPGTWAWGQSGFPSWPLSELSRRPASPRSASL